MAKDKKDKAAKLPKKVAGVKVPRKLRKAGKAALKLAKEPAVGEVVAAALLSAAAALRAGTDPKARAAAEAGGEAVEDVKRQAGQLGETLKAIAIDFARRTLDNVEKGGRSGSARSKESRASDEAAVKPAKA